MSAQPAEADPRCRHHKELDSAIRALNYAASSVEDAAAEIPSADEWLRDSDSGAESDEVIHRLNEVARLVHGGHDIGRWQWCRHETCLALNDLREYVQPEKKR